MVFKGGKFFIAAYLLICPAKVDKGHSKKNTSRYGSAVALKKQGPSLKGKEVPGS